MHSFKELSQRFKELFTTFQFPSRPSSLYEPCDYFLKLGGKRVRPVLCLMANELFDEIKNDAWPVATAIELFHNFTLIHDDIMDNAPLRRGMSTVHAKFGGSTALLAGDAMFVLAYEQLNRIQSSYLHKVLDVFNETARKVCEGQQLDMDYEKEEIVSLDEYLHMIELKTSVLLAASLKLGAIIGGATQRNQELLYNFGKKLGLAFQVQDDYLDAFGDASKTGKETGGDIRSNKKTFLLIHAFETCSETQKKQLSKLLTTDQPDKTQQVLQVYRDCKADEWALELKNKFLDEALHNLEEVAVQSKRKQQLIELAQFLVQRDY